MLVALSLVVWVTPGDANAPAVQATDPSANSPAGVIYSIPLDSARQDASPHGHSGAGSGSAGGGGSGAGGGGGGTGGGGSGAGGGGGTGGGGSGAGGSGSAAGSSRPAGGSTGGSSGGQSDAGGNGGLRSTAVKSVPVLVPGGQPGSLVHSANGFGSSSSVPGLDAPLSSGYGAVQSNASSAPLLAFLLALLVLSVGGFAGARAWRSQRKPPSSAA